MLKVVDKIIHETNPGGIFHLYYRKYDFVLLTMLLQLSNAIDSKLK